MKREKEKKENAKGNTNPIMSPLFRKLYNFFFNIYNFLSPYVRKKRG